MNILLSVKIAGKHCVIFIWLWICIKDINNVHVCVKLYPKYFQKQNVRNYWRKLLIGENSYLLCLGYDNDEVVGTKMLHFSNQINTLKQWVEDENLQRRSVIWKSSENEIELCNITCGAYKLNLSSSYMQEHLKGNSEIFVNQENNPLIYIRLQSCHASSGTCFLWIE